MPLLSLFIDLQNKILVRGFNSSIQTSMPPLYQGDTLTLFLRFMNPTGLAQPPYVDADESTAAVEAAIGTIGGVPTAGTFTITDSVATQTTATIPFNASASTVQTAIQAALTTNWGAATVTGPTGGPWIITNGANASHPALVVDGTALFPASQGDVVIQQAGSGSEPAIQYIRLQLVPIAYNGTWTPYPAPTADVANVQTGGVAGSNSIQSITLNNQPYAGTFTVSFGGQTTAPLAFNSTPSAIQAALQALSSIGSGNCTVGGTIGAYQITFIGSLGGAAQAAFTTSAGGLTGPLALTGTFSLATVGIEEAIGNSSNITQTFEIRLTPSGGNPQTILQTSVQIFNDLIPNAPAIPTPTPVYLTETIGDGRYTQKANDGSDFASLSQTLKNLWLSIGTTLGDLIYSAASGVATRVAGNATSTKKFLTQTGTGSASAAPGWNTIAQADLPIKRLTGILVAGTVTITDSSIVSGSIITPTHTSTVATHSGALYESARTTGTVTITSTNALDVDTVDVAVE